MTNDEYGVPLHPVRGSRFTRREFIVAAGGSPVYDEADWRDALVIVERGRIELETTGGARRLFNSGDILWLTGLSIRALHNPGQEPTVLVALVRRSRSDGTKELDISEE